MPTSNSSGEQHLGITVILSLRKFISKYFLVIQIYYWLRPHRALVFHAQIVGKAFYTGF